MQPVLDDTPATRLGFLFNPNQVTRSRAGVWAHSNVALVDHFTSGQGSVPVQWVRNPPATISFELLLDISKKPGFGTNDPLQDAATLDVEDELGLLESFTLKSPRYGEPPELLFSLGGKKVERIRIMNLRRTDKLWNDKLNVIQATVQVDAIVTFSVGT